MAEQENNATPKPVQTGGSEVAEDRFRYIGFEVFPKQIKEFWKSDSEQKGYLQRVRETAGRFVPLSRANSFVAATVLSSFEKIVLAAASVILVAAPFIPWFSMSRGDQTFTYSGISVAMSAGSVMEYLSLGAGKLTVAYLMLVAMMFLSLLFGLVTLAVLFAGGGNPEQQVTRIRKILLLQYIPIIGWVVFFVVAGSPTELPFAGSLGLTQVQSSLNIGSLSAASSVGLWMSFAALWINAIKGNEL